MPKIIDYPRASLRNSIALADAVYELGGTCAPATAADKLGKKMGGGFKAVIGAAVKYGLISSKKGKLSVEQLYREYKLAYTPEEQKRVAERALLSVPLFSAITERFSGKKLPVDHFDKLLIREFAVPDDVASRVKMYFFEGGKAVGLIGEDSSIREAASSTSPGKADAAPSEDSDVRDYENENEGQDHNNDKHEPPVTPVTDASLNTARTYSVRVQGPGIDSVVFVNDEDDLFIVNTILKKIQRSLTAQQNQGLDSKKGEGEL